MNTYRAQVDEQVRSALGELVIEFNWKLDHAEPAGFSNLFEPEGVFITAQGSVEGSDALDAFAVKRTAMDRTSRSVLSNHRLVALSPDVVEGTVLVTLYMHDGIGVGVPVPHSVSEYRDVYAKGSDGAWRFRERRSTSVFARA